MLRQSVAWLIVALLACAAGCRFSEWVRSEKIVTMPDLTPTALDYVDADGFDGLFEAALVNREPVIQVRTGRETADWDARLNAWIAAWNRGGTTRARTARGQTGVPRVVIDGDSIREFRLLVDGLLGRIDEVAESGSAWYRDQRERSRRVALLKPYNLRFHMGDDGTIQLFFFHEQYSAYYSRFVQKLTRSETAAASEWTRGVECSECKPTARRGRLTNREQ